MLVHDDADLKRVAAEIQEYLGKHPNAADTLVGITKWWLPRQRIEESASLVQLALDHLLAEASIERRTNLDGEQIYFSIRRPLNGNQSGG